MGLSLADNRNQTGFGTFVILLYALYGTYIASLFILESGKGGLRSANFLLFVIIVLLLGLTNLGKLLITRTFKISQNSILLLFFVYILLKLIIVGGDSQTLNLEGIFGHMGVHFITGFIAFSVLKTHMPIIAKIIAWPQRDGGTRSVVIIATLIFIVTILYVMTLLMGTSLSNIFQFKYLTNEYYQSFGDYASIAYCCLVSLQISYFKREIYQNRLMVVFALWILAQVILVGICLQMVNSNKSVVLIALVSILAIYYCKPKDWLISNRRIKASTLFSLSLGLLIGLLLLTQLLGQIDITKMRIFDYGETTSVLDFKGLDDRLEIIRLHGVDQLSKAPLFGDLSIENYMHSSVLSVQSHLGFMGSFLLWSFVIIQLRNVYRDKGNECLKAIALPILFVSVIGDFFTWGLLWFLMGGLYEYTSPKR